MVKPPRPQPQRPIRREDSSPPSSADSGEHVAAGEENLTAAFAGMEAAGQSAATRVAVEAWSKRQAESDGLTKERFDRLDNKVDRRFGKLEAWCRKKFAEQAGDIAEIKADQIRILLALSQNEADKLELRRRLVVAEERQEERAAELEESLEALESTDRHVIDDLKKRASRGDEFMERMAKKGLGLVDEEKRTEIALMAEGRRAWIKTASTIALAAFGGGGVVWVLLSKGCG